MNKEDLKKIVEKSLLDMGCVDVLLEDASESTLVATFNCKEITSFVTELSGWTYSGIQLDPTGKRQYKIDFTRS